MSEGRINEFVGLKSKMPGKESNTVKGVTIVTEFNEFKETLFNKKVVTQNEKNSKQKTKNWHKRSQQNIIIMF